MPGRPLPGAPSPEHPAPAPEEEDREEAREEDAEDNLLNAPDGGDTHAPEAVSSPEAMSRDGETIARRTSPEELFGEGFDASEFIMDDGAIDEAGIEAAVRAAMADGGEAALRAALCPDDPKHDGSKVDDPATEGASRAPP